MHIFIDESGLFSTEPLSYAWSTVGAVAIPDGSLSKVSEALKDLKKAYGIEPCQEFKRQRPDCASEPYHEFLEALDAAGCTLHVLSTRSSKAEAEGLEAHKNKTILAIKKYAEKDSSVATHVEKVVTLVRNLSNQEYNQCILQSQVICNMLPKIISYYAGVLPCEIGKFKWVVDRKNISENRYERAFKELYVGLVSVRSIKQASSILAGRDYSAFCNAFCPNEDIDRVMGDLSEVYEMDLTRLAKYSMPMSLSNLLRDEFSLEDSRFSDGIQVADLLVSSVNRCLKQNYTDNFKMAKALGKLMINAPRIDEHSLNVFGHSATHQIDGTSAKLLITMDTSSKKLYSQKFRENFSKNFPLQESFG